MRSIATKLASASLFFGLFAGNLAGQQSFSINDTYKRDGAIVQDISWPAGTTGWAPIAAYLIKPEKEGRYAGIVYFHMLGGGINRGEFFNEAVKLTDKGVASILIQGTVPWRVRFTGKTTDADLVAAQVGELQHAFEILSQTSGVDSSRMAFVGHDYGAMFGIAFAASKPRIAAFAFVAATPSFADWAHYFFRVPNADAEAAYAKVIGLFEPVKAVAVSTQTPYFFQFANKDAYIEKDRAQLLFDAAVGAKAVSWVDSTHEKVANDGASARLSWLLPKIGVEP